MDNLVGGLDDKAHSRRRKLLELLDLFHPIDKPREILFPKIGAALVLGLVESNLPGAAEASFAAAIAACASAAVPSITLPRDSPVPGLIPST